MICIYLLFIFIFSIYHQYTGGLSSKALNRHRSIFVHYLILEAIQIVQYRHQGVCFLSVVT